MFKKVLFLLNCIASFACANNQKGIFHSLGINPTPKTLPTGSYSDYRARWTSGGLGQFSYVALNGLPENVYTQSLVDGFEQKIAGAIVLHKGLDLCKTVRSRKDFGPHTTYWMNYVADSLYQAKGKDAERAAFIASAPAQAIVAASVAVRERIVGFNDDGEAISVAEHKNKNQSMLKKIGAKTVFALGVSTGLIIAGCWFNAQNKSKTGFDI